MEPVLDWIRSTAVSQWVTGSPWIWPAMETLHFTGLCLLLGGLMIMDVRLIGYRRGLSLRVMHQMLPLVYLGFGINATTGFLFVMGDPHRYAVNYAFRVKVVLLLLAGLNTLFYALKVRPALKNWTEATESPPVARIVAILSLALWTGVGVHGRLITFFG